MKEKLVEYIGEIAKSMIEDAIGNTKEKLKDAQERKKAIDKALEGGVSEAMKVQLEELAATFQDELGQPQTGYSDEQLQEIFWEKYEACPAAHLDGGTPEALCQRFVIACKAYLGKKAEGNSFAQNAALHGIGIIDKKIDKQSEYLQRLCRGTDMPLLEVDSMEKVHIEKYYPGVAAAGNTIAFEKNAGLCKNPKEEWDDFDEPMVYIITLPMRNVGHLPIDALECRKLDVRFCTEASEREGELDSIYIMKHENSNLCDIKVNPSSVQKLNLVVAWGEEELEDEGVSNYFYEEDMHTEQILYIEMVVTVYGGGEKSDYKICMYLVKKDAWEIGWNDEAARGKVNFPGDYEVSKIEIKGCAGNDGEER